jgi:hypothetical protein
MGALLLMLTAILSLIMIHSPGTGDVSSALNWTEVVYQNGLVAGYSKVVSSPDGDYPPVSYAILYMARAFGTAVGLSPLMSFKVTLLTYQLVSASIVLLLSRSYWVAAAFNASLLLSGIGLGYMDVCVAPPLIAAFWAFQSRRNVLGTALFLIASLTKWQPLIVAPFIGVYLLEISNLRSCREAVGRRLFWQLVILVAVTIALLGVVFGFDPERSLWHNMNHPFLSGNALNLPWVGEFFYTLLSSSSASRQDELQALIPRSIGLVTYVIWNSGVHENHLFVAAILAYMLMLHQRTREHWAIVTVLAVMFNVNMFVFYGVTGTKLQSPVVGVDLSGVLAMLYAVAWLLLVMYAWEVTQPRKEGGNAERETHLPATVLN